MNSDDAFRFEPPEHGLLTGESVVWSRPAGISFTTIFCGGCSPLLAVIPGPMIFIFLGELIGYAFYLLLLIAFVLSLRSFIVERRTMYYITSERVIHIVGGQIVQAILLSHLEGSNPETYLVMKVTAHVNNSPVYSIEINDPQAPISIKLKNVEDDKAEEFERLGEMNECPNCGYGNISVRPKCKKCDTVLK